MPDMNMLFVSKRDAWENNKFYYAVHNNFVKVTSTKSHVGRHMKALCHAITAHVSCRKEVYDEDSAK